MSKKTLGLFFTKGVSVETWKKIGILDREKLIYEKLISNKIFDKIYWFTYGSSDKKYEEELHKGIQIISMPIIFKIPLGKLIYSFLMPFLQRKHLKKCQIYKTNQIWGSWAAVISKWLYHKVLYVRTGFTLSNISSFQKKEFLYFKSIMVEYLAYKTADFSAVSSEESFKYITEKYKIKNIVVIPNFIDAELFHPLPKQKEKDLIFIGRLDEVKNLINLVKAVAETDYSLDIYGDGNLYSELLQLTKQLNIEHRVKFKGKVANKELPTIINTYKIYILPSFYEGMPKTLLEAMSCGAACIGTNVNGISEVLEHEKNGIITNTDSENIRKAIENLMQNEELRGKIGKKARIDIENKFSLEKVFELEKTIYLENNGKVLR